MAHEWARWLHNPYRARGPHRFTAGLKIPGGPQVGKVATSPLPPRGCPPLHSGGQNHRWPTSGQGGYITRAACGVPTASQSGAESQVGSDFSPAPGLGGPRRFIAGGRITGSHKWARWLHNPYPMRGPHRFSARLRITGGPQVVKVAT